MNGVRVPVPVVARLLDHSNVRMTRRFVYLGDRDTKAEADRIKQAIAEIIGF